jgi:hypothetical protein
MAQFAVSYQIYINRKPTSMMNSMLVFAVTTSEARQKFKSGRRDAGDTKYKILAVIKVE